MPKLSSANLNRRPAYIAEWDIAESQGFLDTYRFRQYCVEVQKTIETLNKKGIQPTYGDMRRAMKERFVDRFHADALDTLEGVGSVRKVNQVSPLRYEAKTLPVKKKGGYITLAGSVKRRDAAV